MVGIFHRSCDVQGGVGYILIGAVVGVYFVCVIYYYDRYILLLSQI
jgi:hypothetical protein